MANLPEHQQIQFFALKKKSHHRFFLTFDIFQLCDFCEKMGEMVENCSQGETFVKGGWKFSNMLVE